MKHALAIILGLSCGITAHAQSAGRFTIVRSVIAGGGTTFSTAGNIDLASTIGQPATDLLSSSPYSVRGGFWITPSFLIFAPVKNGDSFTLSFETTAGQTYIVEYTESLFNPNWQPLPNVAGDGTVKTVSDPTSSDVQRYYRIRQQ